MQSVILLQKIKEEAVGDTDLSWSVWVLEEGRFGGVEVEKMCHFLNKNPKKQINRQEKQTVNGKWKASWRANRQQSGTTRFPWEADTKTSVHRAPVSIYHMWTQMKHDPHAKYTEKSTLHFCPLMLSQYTADKLHFAALLHFIFQREHHKDKIKPLYHQYLEKAKWGASHQLRCKGTLSWS